MAEKKNYSEKIISAFLESDKITEIMEKTGLSRSTVDRYKKDPDLQFILAERRTMIVESAISKMEAAMVDAAETLRKIIADENVGAQTRIYAISTLFSQCRSWVETVDIMHRLEKLEKEMEE